MNLVNKEKCLITTKVKTILKIAKMFGRSQNNRCRSDKAKLRNLSHQSVSCIKKEIIQICLCQATKLSVSKELLKSTRCQILNQMAKHMRIITWLHLRTINEMFKQTTWRSIFQQLYLLTKYHSTLDWIEQRMSAHW